ncbi:TolC family protein [Alkalinema sp. FACHB-956]|uniref:TolC family protein n=1 Tax=Alkalinema sp. FACHB-956 TaxID=2692768 RepID=UPI0016854042|nr:TolC family protein [Alkalinema sp. FACHB-956]MBD2328581.1 TolC family protein [Alkalinema sp. FACHB-956]
MKTLHLFFLAGVGALITVGHAGSSSAQSVAPQKPLSQPSFELQSPHLGKLLAAVNAPEEFSPQTMPLPSSLQQTQPASSPNPAPNNSNLVPATPSKSSVPKSSTPLPPSQDQPTQAQPNLSTPSVKPATPGMLQERKSLLTEDQRKAPAPELLNPHANPLLFPTKTEEVKLAGAQPITLNQALELAERNNRDIQVSKLELERSKAVLRQAQASLFPTLELQGTFTRSENASTEISLRSQRIAFDRLDPFQKAFQQAPPEGDDQPITSLNTQIQLNYDIYTSGRRPAQIRAAEKQVRTAELALEQAQEKIQFDVASAYYDLQDAEEQVRINRAAVENAQQSLSDSEKLLRAGLGTSFDVLRSQVQLANNQQQLTNSQANWTIRRRQLAQLLSLPEFAEILAADPVEKAGEWKLSLEESIITAYKNRAEMETQLVQREISEAQRKAALATLGPTLSVQADYNLLKIFEQPVPGFSDGYSLSAVARWSLFDGGSARAQAKQQEINKQIAETRFAQTRNVVRFEVEQAYASLQANAASIETTTLAVTQAERALYLARIRFREGVGTQTDVINAQTDLTRAQGNRLSAIIGYNRSLAQLRRAISNIARE